jgi:hypothetical protein
MPWHIEQGGGDCAASQWAVIKDSDGSTSGCHDTREAALEQMAALYASEASAGTLPDRWQSVDGIAFSEVLPDGRDFSSVSWQWRDPEVSLLPLMLQTTNAMGHDGAVLAGFIQSLSDQGGTISAAGSFYDNEAGRQARDILEGGGRFGVSVDPGPNTAAEFRCTEEEDGWCLDGEWTFSIYEIVGLTMTPFPGFARAAITLEGEVATKTIDESITAALGGTNMTYLLSTNTTSGSLYAPVVASAPIPTTYDVAPRSFFDDPEFDEPTALTITDDGHIAGHLALWGECHIGLGPGCVTPPFEDDHQFFHLGAVATSEGELACGVITIGCGHADTSRPLTIAEVLSHYDNAGSVAAYVRAGADSFGPWVSGWVDPDLTGRELRQLRACKLSGDWREVRGKLRLVAALSVPVPGFGVPRLTASVHGGRVTALVASMPDQPCGCGGDPADRLASLEGEVARLSLIVDELGMADEAAARIAASL